MNKNPIRSRNRPTEHSTYTICKNCGKRIYYSSLHSDEIEYFSKNTLIITCPYCYEEQVPDVSVFVDYVYSNKCKTRDKRSGKRGEKK